MCCSIGFVFCFAYESNWLISKKEGCPLMKDFREENELDLYHRSGRETVWVTHQLVPTARYGPWGDVVNKPIPQ